jgi:hypothetical protein
MDQTANTMRISEVKTIIKTHKSKPMNNSLKIEIFTPGAKRKTMDDNLISISKSCISFGAHVLSKLAVKEGEYIMMGSVGKTLYIAARPSVGLPGCKVARAGVKNVRLTCVATDIQANFQGKYELGEVVPSKTKTSEDTTVEVVWHKCVPQ